ncbi:zinc knuckle TRAMP complex subunit Air1 [Schizosaccharomyces cryophilus OY26]|uniref:Zinc knuckle TRAMP complex subunit Air1 n=1 Tax=Schizosaccharomyces cryophilus (strain OY26 / ATCC MYA-4695 / CBS 11777 / NBRC 106824 / NRRL Y48691) TaxID=653667 RepID=S9W733_SCHCR|nr:zinc knuckle TRAMP complex subunit Air1 [Schizosaccharomyces cryophilus OY26]EPY54314.1 zinc knuckle TRAMP complex subunit Air1 [Schizosaccharomyces cryophilus OY26]
MTVINENPVPDDISDGEETSFMQKIFALPVDPKIQEAIPAEKPEGGENEEVYENDSSTELSESTLDEVEGGEWADVSRGRYFGADPSETILCHNCKGFGHIAKECPHTLCTTCGAIDDHISPRCPRTKRCINCGLLGHIAVRCPESRRKGPRRCLTCNTESHTSWTCPLIWRYYVETDTGVRVNPDEVKKYCYNCASGEHFGDDCHLPSRSNYPESTAFCEANCPTGNDVSNSVFNENRKTEFGSRNRDSGKSKKNQKYPKQRPTSDLGSRIDLSDRPKRKYFPADDKNEFSFRNHGGKPPQKKHKKFKKNKW